MIEVGEDPNGEKEVEVFVKNDCFLSADELEAELVGELTQLQRERKKAKERINIINNAMARGVSRDQEEELFAEATELNEHVANMINDLYVLVSRATRGNYSPEDVASWMSHSAESGVAGIPITSRLIKDLVHLNIVPNTPFRRRYAELKDTMKPRELAWRVSSALRRLEESNDEKYGSSTLMRKDKGKQVGDHTGIERLLGERPYAGTAGKRYKRAFINYFQAVALADVLGIQYQHVGI